MDCDFYKKQELGQLEESVFIEHVKKCRICRDCISEDEKLIFAAKALRRPVERPNLWAKIEKNLLEQKNKEEKSWRRYFPILRIAAALFLFFGLFSVFQYSSNFQDSKLLATSTLTKVEQKEKDLESAISELEKIALPKLSDMNLDLMFLYRDRLETIEAQIAQCKEMLSENPANAHLWSYLLAAYKDKKETLIELMKDNQL